MMKETKYKNTEVGVIPEDWEVRTLGEVGEVKMCKRIFSYQTKDNGDIPFYKIGTFGKEPDAFISKEVYNEFRRKYSFPSKGSVLISAAGTIGRIIVYNGDDAYFQDSNIVWIDNNNQVISNEYLKHSFPIVKFRTEGGTIQRLYNNILKSGLFPSPPTKTEQTAIATALSDADALINSLSKLITKKRNIKQGAMQQLLNPMVNGELLMVNENATDSQLTTNNLQLKEGWEVKKLGEILKVKHGKNQQEIEDKSGRYPILGTGGLMGFTNHYLSNKPSVLIGRKGTIDKPQFMETPFWTVDTLFYTEIFEGYNAKFIYYVFNLIDWYSLNEASGVPSLNAKTIEKIERGFPPFEEQTRIATILSDMDAEISALETKLEKYKKVKLGMMQVLLTGKIRLV